MANYEFPTLDPEIAAAARRPPVIEEPALEDRTERARSLSQGEPSRPLMGLPLARLIPQDVHSVMDYGNAGLVASCALMTRDPRAVLASLMLGSSDLGMSLVTDYRLSVAKLIPIETHEAVDHIWGMTAIAAPFVLGYWKTAPKVALVHVMAGVGNIIASLFTDYRAYSRRGRR